jgi:hypothetical protein
MRVKWKYVRPLHTIPEMYWSEDLSLLDVDYEGDVIGTTKSFWGTTYLTVACDDGKVRECPIRKAVIVRGNI